MEIRVGAQLRGKTVREMRRLSNGWLLLKTDNGKSARDYRVKLITQMHPRVRSVTPKHAHFVIDFYGKLCNDIEKAARLFEAISRVWAGESVELNIHRLETETEGLPGYPVEYILAALDWILAQEDINFTTRPEAKQAELEDTLRKAGVDPVPSRQGSHLAMALLCNVRMGMHPVEAFLKAQLDVIPVKRARGAV